MIFAVDIGNSSISFALIANQIVINKSSVSSSNLTSDTLYDVFSKFIELSNTGVCSIQRAVVSCVVPELFDPVSDILENIFSTPCFVIKPGIRVGMTILYEPPESLGSDRVVNAYATRVKYGFPSICIDFGTATSFCVLNSNGDFQGGAIVPGLKSFSRILSQTTAQLPQTSFDAPPDVIAKSTESNIQSGLVYGYISLVEGLLKRMKNELKSECPVIATGGAHRLIINKTDSISIFDENLTLAGLELLYKTNRENHNNLIWG
jgi:type III pantothenate kinase